MAATATNPDVSALARQAKENSDAIAAVTKSVNGLVEKMSKTAAFNQPSPEQVFGAPGVRRGEDTMTSRGFSFLKMMGMLTGAIEPSQASVEVDMANRLHNCYVKDLHGNGFEYGATKCRPGSSTFLAPLATSFMTEEVIPRNFRLEMKGLVRAGAEGVDAEETAWIRKKMLMAQGYGSKALSWLNELTGGALVAPPEMGELIELLRSKEALVNAGARVVPLPPQGRMRYPRQTSPSLAYWVGEHAPIPDSNIGTGDILLQAKKLAVMIKAPNELIRFASPAAEALMRDDMSKALALGLDLAGLEGVRTDNRPQGIINYANITRISSSTQGANGDTLIAQDAYRMIAAIEESNAEMGGFIMRPKTLSKYFQLRADAVTAADRAGPFLFNLIREQQDGVPAQLAGYPVTKSTQVSQVRNKGTSSSLTYVLAGNFSEVLIGMFGAIEFAATTMGDTAFTNDQTWVRAILSADIQLRHEAAFALLDNLDLTL